ncbi:T9SS type A sorting domain-containing protein [Kordia antarctica]|nr:T9SS type A sorting domain-containing protein [Kordia antarctica]
MLDTSTWTVGTGSVSGFSQYGITSENSRVIGNNHVGDNVVLWKASPDVNGTQSGGFGSSYENINHTKDYRLSVWIKKTNSNDGSSYFKLTSYTGGVHHTLKLDGAAVSYPAFWVGDLPKLDRWYLFVGYIHKSSYSSTINLGKIYDGVTGEVVQSITDFKFKSSATNLQHRTFLYGDTNIMDRQYMYAPRMEVIDGTEWSLNQLLRINPGSKLLFVYDNAGNQKQRFYCAVASCSVPNPPAGRAASEEVIVSKESEIIEDGISVLEKEFSLYPNPTQGSVLLKFSSNSGVSLSDDINVYNSLGILVKTIPSESKNELEIDLSNLSTGMYLVHIHLSNGESITKQIIKK